MRTACLTLVLLSLVACGGETDAPSPTEGTTPATADADTPTTEPTAPTTPTPAKPKPPASPPAVVATWRGEGTTLQFNAWKMGCSGCESTIQKRIGEIEGVTAVEADLASTEVTVTLDGEAARETVIAAITKALETPESGRKFEIVRAKESE